MQHHGPLTRYVKLWFAHAPGMPGTSPHHRFQRKPPVSDPSMHHGTCVAHVQWCMSGSLTRSGGENVPGIPAECTTREFRYLARALGDIYVWLCLLISQVIVFFTDFLSCFMWDIQRSAQSRLIYVASKAHTYTWWLPAVQWSASTPAGYNTIIVFNASKNSVDNMQNWIFICFSNQSDHNS